MRIGGKILFSLVWIVLLATPALAGHLFIEADLGKGWLKPGGYSIESVTDTLLTGQNDFDHIASSVELGARLGYRFLGCLEAGIAYSRQNHDHSFYDSYSLREYKFPTTWYEGFVAFSPWRNDSWRWDVGASAGVVTTDGHSRFSILEYESTKTRFQGDAVTFSGFTTLELGVAKNASLLVRFGYRQAEIEVLEDVDGNGIEFVDGQHGLNFSGLFSGVGFRFYIN